MSMPPPFPPGQPPLMYPPQQYPMVYPPVVAPLPPKEDTSIPLYANSKSLHVSGLDARVDEHLLKRIFMLVGHVVNCKIMKDKTNTHAGYGFVDFIDHTTAEFAKENMNGRLVYGRELKVNWTYESGQDNGGNAFRLFVGGLHPEVTDEILFKHFKRFGQLTDARVLKQSQTGKSKGYGFVAYAKKEDADKALIMNGEKIEGRSIKVNYVTANTSKGPEIPMRSFEAVYAETPKTNCTVYVGNLPIGKNVNDEAIKTIFKEYGEIEDIRYVKEKGYAFIRYLNHDCATRAIMHLNGQMVLNSMVRCSWGRDTTRQN